MGVPSFFGGKRGELVKRLADGRKGVKQRILDGGGDGGKGKKYDKTSTPGRIRELGEKG